MLKFVASEQGFMPPEKETFAPAESQAVIIPFGLEKTVSYEGGTAQGPQAIINASQELEYFDDVFWSEPRYAYGIGTLETPKINADIAIALDEIESVVAAVLDAGKFPLILGGEHSLTAGAIRPFVSRFDSITLLQFDAHADLRDGYEGEHFSHASAMCRCLDYDNVRLVAAGIRNISAAEVPFLEANKDRIDIFWARDKAKWNAEQVAAAVGDGPVYITFDLDGFDSSLMPATGTPEPGGLFWDETIEIISAVSKQAKIVGADVVELAPRQGLHACDFLTAKLAYKILSYALLPRQNSA
jgi:agmatinase